ncbi:MAG: helix-turn-helix transcriptional regulator [Proteobacteria bacterium]|nr:helix-turn-helix transcriptional regulator [Pseudomonadota bacterium]
MEGQFQLDWQAIVKTAIKRRKESRLTQKQLAALVGVSTPTVNRFERQKKNITLESAFAILEILGLLKKQKSQELELKKF